MAVEYPKREPFFAHKFVRMLTKSCAAQDIGLNAFALLCVIAHQEDSARYCGPVRFWNEQLMSTLALSPRALREARDKAVKFGWLTYFRENDRATGRYFVTIPKRFAGLSDAPIEEPEVFSGAVRCEVSGDASGADLHKEVHKEVTSNRTRSEHESAPEPSPPSIPIPDPIPLPEEIDAADADEPDNLPAVVTIEKTGPANIVAAGYIAAIGGKVVVTDKRRKAITARWKDQFWREHWQEALEVASSTPFLQGTNDRGWKMNFDWFLKPDSVAKILEGNYSGGSKQGNQTAAEKREQLNASGFDWIRQAAAEAAASGDHRGGISSGSGATLLLEEHGATDSTCF